MITTDENSLIMEYLFGKGNLSDSLKYKLKLCIECKDLIRQYKSRLKVIPILMNGYEITEKKAYEIYQDTEIIFNVDKKDKRNFHIDILMADIAETRNKAMAAKDFKTVAACDKNYHNLLKDFFGTEERPDYSKLQPVQVNIGFYPEILGTNLPSPRELEKLSLQLMKVKSSKINVSDAEDVAHEE